MPAKRTATTATADAAVPATTAAKPARRVPAAAKKAAEAVDSGNDHLPAAEAVPAPAPVKRARVRKVAAGDADPAPAGTAPKREKQQPKKKVVREVVPTKAVAGVMSPRTTVSRFSTKSDKSLDDMTDVKSATNSLSRNVNYAIRAAMLIGENGECTINGKSYVKKDITELSRSLASSVKRIPGVCRGAAAKRRGDPISDDEAARRTSDLHDRMVKHANTLASHSVKKILPILIEKGDKRIGERVGRSTTASRFKPDAGAIEKPFFISNTLRRFISKGEFGNGWGFLYNLPAEAMAVSGASNPEKALAAATEALGFDPSKKLGLTAADATLVANPLTFFKNLTVDRGIATSPILMSLMSAYINANSLRDPTTNRIRVDGLMRETLGGSSTTEHTHANSDFTPADLKETCKLSGLARLESRDGKEGALPPFDGETFTRPMNIVLANYYRISSPSDEMLETLKHPAILALCAGVKLYL